MQIFNVHNTLPSPMHDFEKRIQGTIKRSFSTSKFILLIRDIHIFTSRIVSGGESFKVILQVCFIFATFKGALKLAFRLKFARIGSVSV